MEEVRRWIDLVYPPRCAVCERFLRPGETGAICPDCGDGLKEVRSPLCSRCGVPFETGTGEDRLCGRCLRERSGRYRLVRTGTRRIATSREEEREMTTVNARPLNISP